MKKVLFSITKKFDLGEVSWVEENDKALIKYLEAQKAAGAALDTTAYESYDAWIDTIKKQIKKSESTLTNIEFKKVELEAVNQYLA